MGGLFSSKCFDHSTALLRLLLNSLVQDFCWLMAVITYFRHAHSAREGSCHCLLAREAHCIMPVYMPEGLSLISHPNVCVQD